MLPYPGGGAKESHSDMKTRRKEAKDMEGIGKQYVRPSQAAKALGHSLSNLNVTCDIVR